MKKLFVIGDSISMHYGPYLEQYIQGVYEYKRKGMLGESEDPADDIVLGGNGGDSSMVLAYVKKFKQLISDDCDTVMFNCGLHDIKTKTNSNEKQIPLVCYEKNLREIVKILSSISERMIWIRTTPVVDKIHNRVSKEFHRFDADVMEYNAAADRIMKTEQIDVIDLYTFTKNLGGDTYLDHVHFKKETRKLQAAYIADFLINA